MGTKGEIEGKRRAAAAEGEFCRDARGDERGASPGRQCGVGAAEGRAPHLGSLLLKFLNGPFVDAPAFVDEVPGGGGFPRVHMPDDHDVDVRLLLPHAAGLTGLAGAGGAGEGGGNAAAFWGRLRGKSQACQKEPPLCQPLSQPFGKRCPSLAPPSRWTTQPGVPGPSGSSVRAGSEPACPRRRPAGLFRAATSSLQDSARCRVFRHLALHRPRGDPHFPGLRHGCCEGALPPWKTFPLPSRSFQTRGHLLHVVGALGGAEGALTPPQLGTVQVTTECLQNGVDKNSPRLLPQAGLRTAGLPRAPLSLHLGGLLYFAAMKLDGTEGGG